MRAAIIQIGNSKGVRLSKEVLLLSGISGSVEVKVKKGEIKLVAVKPSGDEFKAAADATFATDWLRPEEDAAWQSYQ